MDPVPHHSRGVLRLRHLDRWSVILRERKRPRDLWSTLGEANPYFAVCTDKRFRRDRMTDADRREFFESGEQEVATTFRALESIAPGMRPSLAVDFGCGVGRLTIPVAKRCGRVIGVDVSAPMLREAERNCAEQDILNARFAESSSLWSALDGAAPDFVHAYIVFQHIPPGEGMKIAAELLGRLAPGGVGALQFLHVWRAGRLRRTLNALRQSIPPVNAVLNAIQGRPIDEPSIPMFAYEETAVRELLRRFNCEPASVLPTDHGGFLGAMYLFRKNRVGA